MKRALHYYFLLVITLMTISSFVFAETLAQVFSAMLFFPLFIFFVDLALTRKKPSKTPRKQDAATGETAATPKPALLQLFRREKPPKLVTDEGVIASTANNAPTQAERSFAEDGEVLEDGVDANRRLLLKTIASAGVGLFLMTLFTNKANAAFFGSVPGPGTIALKDSNDNVIDPAIKTPTDGYKVSEVDDAGSPAYYGFVDKTGAWFIMKEESTGAYRYTKGNSSFSSSWTSRASLTYGYFDSIF